jgi:hypothetical protein
VAVGSGASATASNDSAFGEGASATFANDTALGAGSSVTAINSVALGANSVADRANSVSVGRVDHERQITNVAAATEGTDAVNLNQATRLVAGVKATADTALSTANTALTTAANALSESNAQITALAGSNGSDAMTAADADTLLAANTHAEAGDATTLASANTHADAGDASTLTAANGYTDTRVTSLSNDFNSFKSDVNAQFVEQGNRINTVGALSAALSMIGPDGRIAGDNQFSMGIGNFHSQQAVSVGFSRLMSAHTSVRLGAAFANGENEAGVGFNVGW